MILCESSPPLLKHIEFTTPPRLISFSRTLPPGKVREEGDVGTKPVGACWAASKALVGSVSRKSILIFIPGGVGLQGFQGLHDSRFGSESTNFHLDVEIASITHQNDPDVTNFTENTFESQ